MEASNSGWESRRRANPGLSKGYQRSKLDLSQVRLVGSKRRTSEIFQGLVSDADGQGTAP